MNPSVRSSEIHVSDQCMDKSKLFDIPMDRRRSGSPMVDPLWAEIMESYQQILREYDSHLVKQEALKTKMKDAYEKLRELYRTTIFRRHEHARRSLQAQNSSFTSRHNAVYLEVPVAPPPPKPCWLSCFRPSPTKDSI